MKSLKPVVPIPSVKVVPVPKSIKATNKDPNLKLSDFFGICADDKSLQKADKKRRSA